MLLMSLRILAIQSRLNILSKSLHTRDSIWFTFWSLRVMCKSLSKILRTYNRSIRPKFKSLRTWSEIRVLSLRIKFTLNLTSWVKSIRNFLKRRTCLFWEKSYSMFFLNTKCWWPRICPITLSRKASISTWKRLTTKEWSKSILLKPWTLRSLAIRYCVLCPIVLPISCIFL